MECLENGCINDDFDPIDPDVVLDMSSPTLLKHYKKMTYLQAFKYDPNSYRKRMNLCKPSDLIIEEDTIPNPAVNFL